MMLMRRRAPNDKAHRILMKLVANVRGERHRLNERLPALGNAFPSLEALSVAINHADHVSQVVSSELAASSASAREDVGARLRELSHETLELARRFAGIPGPAANGLAHILSFIAEAEQWIPCVTAGAEGDVRQVVIQSDCLFHAHRTLFPAERMLVVGGRKDGDAISLGASFEVTGKANAAHVYADQAKLGQALIAMTLAGSHLAAWFHSHPGTGPHATHPSSTDREQENDWLKDFSKHLIGAIFVADGWVRFWGRELEDRSLGVTIAGAGVRKEDADGILYRLEE